MPTKGWGEATTELIKGTVKGTAKVVPDIVGGIIEMATKSSATGQKTPQQYQQKVADYKKQDEEDLEKVRKSLIQTTPPHMRPSTKPQALRPYEAKQQEVEQRQAMTVEAQNKQKQSVATPMGRKKTGWFFARKKTKGTEGLIKDTKIG